MEYVLSTSSIFSPLHPLIMGLELLPNSPLGYQLPRWVTVGESVYIHVHVLIRSCQRKVVICGPDHLHYVTNEYLIFVDVTYLTPAESFIWVLLNEA